MWYTLVLIVLSLGNVWFATQKETPLPLLNWIAAGVTAFAAALRLAAN